MSSIRDHRILAVDAGPWRGEDPERRIDCRNRLITPGLVNAHAHSQSSTMSGFGDKLSHPAFMWLTQAHTSRRTPDEIRLTVLLTAYGMMTSGTTAIIDHFPGQRFTRADMDAVLSAWRKPACGSCSVCDFSTDRFRDIFPPAPFPEMSQRMKRDLLKPQPLDELEDLIQDIIMAWGGKPRLRSFPPRRTRSAARKRPWCCVRSLPSVSTPASTRICSKQANRPTLRSNASAPRWCSSWKNGRAQRPLVLCTQYLADMTRYRFHGREASHRRAQSREQRPAGNRSRRYSGPASRRVPLALGTDGASANDNLVMHEAMRAVAMAHRAQEPNRSTWVSARAALRMATTGGARAMRLTDLGALAAGQRADVTIYRLDKPWWLPVNDVVCQLVFAETGAGSRYSHR